MKRLIMWGLFGVTLLPIISALIGVIIACVHVLANR